ncbi:MAG TPA: hypothetical protein VFX58_09545 [Chitinophagaceae bacterium]|nr:hypothetical protein [Chitinophagaceae bacterium]
MRKQVITAVFYSILLGNCGPAPKTSATANPAGSPAYTGSRAAMLDNNTFELKEISSDETYGYSENNPVKVGGVKDSEGPLNERRFLNALLGPNGETVSYSRKGSCCPFKTPNGFSGAGLLDRYEVSYEGLEKPVYIFINMYDFGELRAPRGFSFKK